MKNKQNKSYVLISIGFMIVATVVGLIGFWLSGWSFAEFVKNPIFPLIVLVVLLFGFTLFYSIMKNRINNKGGRY